MESFIQAISLAPLQGHHNSEALSTIIITNTVSEFHAEAPLAAASEGFAQGPYVAARAGFEPMTLRTKGDESTNKPPRPTHCPVYSLTSWGKDFHFAIPAA